LVTSATPSTRFKRRRIDRLPHLLIHAETTRIKPRNRTFNFQSGVFAAFSCCATDVLVEEDVDAVREIVRMVSQRLAASSEENEQRKESVEYTHMMSSLSLEDAWRSQRRTMSPCRTCATWYSTFYVLRDEVWMRDGPW
jgi:hypothetical protein